MPDLNFDLYFYVLFFVILGLATFFGFLKGSRKSLYSFLVMLAFYSLFFLTINIVVDKLWVIKIPGLGSLLGQFIPELSNATSLKQAMPVVLNSYLADSLDSSLLNEKFLVLTTGLSLFVVKIIYAIFYFTFFQMFYKFTFFIIRIILFKASKYKDKPKHRVIGAGFGLLRGIVSVYVTLIILGGTMSIADSVLKLVPEDNNIASYKPMVQAYNHNIFVMSANQINVPGETSTQDVPLNLYFYDSIFSFNYDKEQISFRKEIKIAADITNIYMQSEYKSTNDLSKIKSTEIQEVFTILSGSDLFTTALPLGIELAADYLDTEVSVPKEELYAIDWETEVTQLGEVASVGFDLFNTAGLLGGDANLETITVNGDDVRDLFNSLSDSNLVTLGAFVAIEPLITNASSDIQAIITVPEDLVWEDEFKAIGLVAGAIVDTNITVGTLQTGNPSLMISHLSNLDFTIMLKSKIITTALINSISGNGNIEDFNVFVIPEDIVWLIKDDEGNVIDGELQNILLALNEISQLGTEVNFSNLDLKIISEFNDDMIISLFESRILVATVSKLIVDMDLGNTPLLIADSVFDQDKYIYKAELTALAKSARMVFTSLTCNEGDTCEETGFDISKAFDLSDDDIDILLTSVIIESTLGNLIIDNSGDVLTIPSKSLSTIFVSGVEREIVNKVEIKKLFKAVSALGFTDIDNMAFNASIITNLATEEDVTVLDQVKTDKIFDSNIIHATLSKMLLDLTTNQVLVIPYQDVNDVDIRRYIDEIEYISTDELTSVLESVLVLNISDFADVETLSLDLITSNINTLLNSGILHATLSDQLFSLGDTVVTIPYFDVDDNLIRLTTGELTKETEYIDKDELVNLFDALKLLGITNIDSFQGSITLTTFYDETNRNILLASDIMHATISKQMLDLGSSILTVPHLDSTNNSVRITVGNLEQETEYVSTAEIHAIIKGLEILEITDIKTFSGTIDLNKFYEETTRTTLLTSASMHATISKQMLDLGPTILSIPYFDSTNTSIRTTVGDVLDDTDTLYITTAEIHAIIEGLEILQINDINNFTGTIDLTKFYETDTRTTLLASASMHATVSKQLFDLSSSILNVPERDIDNTLIRLSVGSLDEETEYITSIEIHAIFEALEILNIGEISNFTGTVNLVNLYNELNQDTLLSSASMHATITKQMTDLGANILLIPDKDINENDIQTVSSGTHYIYKSEIKALINALEVLGINDITTFTGTFNLLILSSEINQTTLLNSASIHATISDKLLDLDNDGILIIPLYSQDGYDINIDNRIIKGSFVIEAEIKLLINAFNILGIDFDTSTSLNATAITNMTSTELDTLLYSATIHVTIDDMLKGNIHINTKIPVLAKLDMYDMLDVTKTAEIKAFIQAADLLATGDFTTISFNYTDISSLSETDRSVVLDSMIVRNSITTELELLVQTMPTFTILPTHYEEANVTYFFTKPAVLEILTHYNLI